MSASLPREILKKYKGNFNGFFETGTSEGDTVSTAIDIGFDRIYSVEMDETICLRATDRFAPFPDVYIFWSDSLTALRMLLPLVHEPLVFFLDAHPDCTSGPSPILEELKLIKSYRFPVTIFADDMRLMGVEKWKDSSVENIRKMLESFPQEFEIEQIANEHSSMDLLVARNKEML
jgi:hypothetical protein